MTDARFDARLRACDGVMAWCLRNAERHEAAGALEQAGTWAYVGALTASQAGHSYLCAAPLEALLLRLGERMKADHAPPQRTGQSPQRWLHVLSVSTAVGGHTALARRWIERNPMRQQHAVVLTAQPAADVAPALAAAVRTSGGVVTSIAGVRGLLARAAALRTMAWHHADVVVLHVHPWDVLPVLAFALPGGPPVLLMNHADHAFWVGCAVADQVIDFRDSGAALTSRFRAPRAAGHLPVPLDDVPAAPHERALACAVAPAVTDRRLVLLTVGRASKYREHARLDFARAARGILSDRPQCVLVGVGPAPADPRWRHLASATGDRACALGERTDLAVWHAACDLYLEGFPVGSYTALLEGAQAARPFVRKPLLAPAQWLPVDQGALAAFPPPDTPQAYAEAVLGLVDDPMARRAMAARARSAVHQHHVTQWPAHLQSWCASLAEDHVPGVARACEPMPTTLAAYAAGVLPIHADESPLDLAREGAVQQGLHPRTDVAVLEAVRAWQAA